MVLYDKNTEIQKIVLDFLGGKMAFGVFSVKFFPNLKYLGIIHLIVFFFYWGQDLLSIISSALLNNF